MTKIRSTLADFGQMEIVLAISVTQNVTCITIYEK